MVTTKSYKEHLLKQLSDPEEAAEYLNAALHDVDAVQCQNRIGEGRMRNDRHSVGKIGCHLLNPQSLFLGYLERDCQHILRLCASHGCYQRALTAMAVLVRQEREQVVLE